MSDEEAARRFLRHTLATLAYRGGKAIRGAPEGFPAFSPGPGARSAGQILAHIGDLLDWAIELCDGRQGWRDSAPLSWPAEGERFFARLEAVDRRLASSAPLGTPAERVFQGPVADALTHVGQLSLLRRLAGSPVRGENYFKAEIVAGRVGDAQAAPRREFD
jgi:hypothetical protein